MDSRSHPPVHGTTYKFIVKSASEAAVVIRERLGPEVRVLSVRTVPRSGLRGLWSAPRIEVLAQASQEAPEPVEAPEPALPETGPSNVVVSPAFPPARIAAEPPRPLLASLLRRSGVSEVALARLQMSPFWAELSAAPVHRALVEIGRRLQSANPDGGPREPLTRVAFLGSAGSGRTTALCKWLGSEVFRRGRKGHVVTVEFDRPGSSGPLPLFCEALGVPVLRHPAPVQPAAAGGFVAYDLPSLSILRPQGNAALAAFLARERIGQRVLVMNAAYDHSVLRATYAAGRSLGATHLILTHLDEVNQWGGLWDYLFERALEPLFLANGPSLTGDCDEDVFGAVIRNTLAAGPAQLEAEPEDATGSAAANHS
jgi:flagellar biosynthesis protein FlhF